MNYRFALQPEARLDFVSRDAIEARRLILFIGNDCRSAHLGRILRNKI